MKEQEGSIRPYNEYELSRVGRLAYALEILHWLTSEKLDSDRNRTQKEIIWQDTDKNSVTLSVDDAWRGATNVVLGLMRSFTEYEGMGEEVHEILGLAQTKWDKDEGTRIP